VIDGPGRYDDRVTITMTATEVKAKILALLDEVADGQEVRITKHGRVVARLVPAVGGAALLGAAAGLARTAAEDDDLYLTGARWEAP